MEDLSTFSAKPRLRLMLDHFSKIEDTRQAWKVAYPLCEVLFLVVCGTIANCDDYDDVVDWGNAHLSFLRGFAEFHYGIPCADWLRTVMNRIDPDLSTGPTGGATMIKWVGMAYPRALHAIAQEQARAGRTAEALQTALPVCVDVTVSVLARGSLKGGGSTRPSLESMVKAWAATGRFDEAKQVSTTRHLGT